jgi:hypothetical protein
VQDHIDQERMPDAWSQDEVNGCSQFAAMMQNCAQTRVDQDTFLQRTTEKKFDGAMPLKEKNSLSRLKLFIFLQNCVFSMPSLNEKNYDSYPSTKDGTCVW